MSFNTDSFIHQYPSIYQGLVAGSVPIYYGAPDVLEYLPHPSAIINVRDFDTIEQLAAYLMEALNDASIYEKHTKWKRLPLTAWSPKFIALASKSKSGVFCEVCEWASEQNVTEVVVDEQDTSEVLAHEHMATSESTLNRCKQELKCDIDFAVCTLDSVFSCMKNSKQLDIMVDDVDIDDDDGDATPWTFIFESSDTVLGGDRLPCPYSGDIVIPLDQIKEFVPFNLNIPVDNKLQTIDNFEKIHHHYLLSDFENVCSLYHNASQILDGRCVGHLMQSFDREVAKYCPRRRIAPVDAASLPIDLKQDTSIHVSVSYDMDMQRFYHMFLAEYLPIVSLAQRMIPIGNGSAKRQLVLHSTSRKWGGNPLHGV
jgi:hypothetical protein